MRPWENITNRENHRKIVRFGRSVLMKETRISTWNYRSCLVSEGCDFVLSLVGWKTKRSTLMFGLDPYYGKSYE